MTESNLRNKWLIILLLLFCSGWAAAETSPNRYIMVVTIDGVIGPATDDYLARAFDTARRDPVELIVIQMDTPGGLDTAMRRIIKNITTSPVPVASFVTPTGARAASAGTYIMYASHIAAMSPGTNLGAATPVQLTGPTGADKPTPGKDDKTDTAKDKVQDNQQAMRSKAINDAVAYIKGLARLHGRNADWAEKAVSEAASLPADEALKQNVIDLVATSLPDLLDKVNGRTVKLHDQPRVLQTAGLPVREVEPDWRSKLLSVITNPNVAYILMLIGIYGLIFEFSNPGAIVPGTVGAIALLLALYAFQLLPINYAGMALILLGVALMVGEAYQPSFGMLGIGGVIAFVIGSVILIDTEAPGFGINLSIVLSFTVTSVLIFVVVIGMAIKARRRPVVSGSEQLLGSIGIAREDFSGQGRITAHSEIWNAVSAVPVHRGQRVKITGLDGLTLQVTPLEEDKA